MHVLFVSGIDGFCLRYQVLHRAAQVVAGGGAATVRHFRDPRLDDEAPGHDVLWLYRVPWTPAIEDLVRAARGRGVPVVGSIDDLIFVDDPAWLPDLSGLDPAERSLWREGVRRYRATLELCDAFVAPTEPLAEAAAGLCPSVHLHRNSLAPAELELARRARAGVPRAAGGAVTIGYFSGTPSHGADFAGVVAPLAETLRAHPEARLLVAGPLDLPASLEALGERVERHALVAWHELPRLMARAQIHLAPLATERRFAAAKGEIKYLEAAALALPVVASPSPAYRHAIDDGRNGLLAAAEPEWRRALDALVCDAALRERLGTAALADAASRYGEAARGAELAAVLAAVRGARAAARSVAAGAGCRVSPARPFDAEPPVDPARCEHPARFALEADACPAFPVLAPTSVSPPLGATSRLVQRFRVERDGLFRVDVHTVTYGQRLGHRLRFSLRDERGALVAAAEVRAADAPDRAWLALETTPLADSCGRIYTIEVAALGAGPGDACSFGLTAVAATARVDADAPGGTCGTLGPAARDGVLLDGALALRGFARWELALRAGGSGAGVAERLTGGAVAAAPGPDRALPAGESTRGARA